MSEAKATESSKVTLRAEMLSLTLTPQHILERSGCSLQTSLSAPSSPALSPQTHPSPWLPCLLASEHGAEAPRGALSLAQ